MISKCQKLWAIITVNFFFLSWVTLSHLILFNFKDIKNVLDLQGIKIAEIL